MNIIIFPEIKVELQAVYGTDREIASSAWTSSTEHKNKKLKTDEDVSRVVNMLADLKHSVPFESVVLRFWIKLNVASDRQIMTHRLQSASGMSSRYRTMPNEWQKMSPDVQCILDKAFTPGTGREYDTLCKQANDFYQNNLKYLKQKEKEGIISNSEYKRAREFLRGALPQNNMTERVTVINLRSFANFIKLRLSEHAQPEIRYIAYQMLEAVKASGKIPIAIAALEKNNWQI